MSAEDTQSISHLRILGAFKATLPAFRPTAAFFSFVILTASLAAVGKAKKSDAVDRLRD